MGVSFSIEGTMELIADIDKKISVLQRADLNDRRAKAFKEFAITRVQSNALGLKPITSATERISHMGAHPPLWEDGELLESMEIRKRKKGVTEAGYFASGAKDPRTGKPYAYIVSLHESGFTIPLTKGTRGFLASHGVYPSATKVELKVVARPFLTKAAEQYSESGEDAMIIEEFMEKL